MFDHDNTDESRVLYNYLDRTQNLTSIKDDNEAIADELFFRNVDYVLIIPDGFSENPDSLKNVKQQNSSYAYFLDNSIDTFLNVFLISEIPDIPAMKPRGLLTTVSVL